LEIFINFFFGIATFLMSFKKKKKKRNTMVEKIQDYISSLNWGYRTDLRDKRVEYINSYGAFVDPHTVEATNRAGKKVGIFFFFFFHTPIH